MKNKMFALMATTAADWVVYRSTLRGQRVPKGGGPTPFETKYVDLLHRTATGWEVAFRMWSDNR